MPVNPWGDRVIVNLAWQGSRIFSLNRLPESVPGYKGVYLISSRKYPYKYPSGRSSLAYGGSGSVAERLPDHVRRNRDLNDLLEEEGTMWFRYASASRGLHPCVEQVLFDAFEEPHGARPILNKVRPGCSLDWANVHLHHQNLAFPYDVSRSDFP